MRKANTNFKEMRRKVINPSANQENIPLNPTSKLSFRAIKKETINQECSPSPLRYRVDPPKRILDSNRSNRDPCNKFSLLLESKGYSNAGSAKKEHYESIGNPIEMGFPSTLSERTNRCNTERHEPQSDRIAQKCR